MLGPITLRDSEITVLPKVGDRQYLRIVQEDPFQVKYVLAPIPGFDLAIVGLEEPDNV